MITLYSLTATPQVVLALLIVAVITFLCVGWGVLSLVVSPSRARRSLCPRCGGKRVRPSWQRVSDRPLIWLKPFRCETCFSRFYLLKRLARE